MKIYESRKRTITQTCTMCNGSGKAPTDKRRLCPTCTGRGTTGSYQVDNQPILDTATSIVVELSNGDLFYVMEREIGLGRVLEVMAFGVMTILPGSSNVIHLRASHFAKDAMLEAE